MRRRADPTQPPMTREESVEAAAAARRGHGVSARERQARFRVMEELLGRDLTFQALCDECRLRFEMSPPAVERLRARVLRAWRETERGGTDVRRLQARHRLLSVIRASWERCELTTALKAEALLAKIDGVFVPQQVDVRLQAVASLSTMNHELLALAEVGRQAMGAGFVTPRSGQLGAAPTGINASPDAGEGSPPLALASRRRA